MQQGVLSVGGRRARWAFTTRHSGGSAPPYDTWNLAAHVGDDPDVVRRNRAHLESEFALGALSWMGPVHGIAIAELHVPTAVTPNVDALCTRVSGLPITTLGADCVPMLVASGDLVIAAHVGWRGLVEGMAERLMQLLAAQDASTTTVLLGPAICGACYGIPDDRADLISEVRPEALCAARNGGPGADLRVGLTAAWRHWGAQVQSVGPCTFESSDHFSHRRDGITGRQAGVIAWV